MTLQGVTVKNGTWVIKTGLKYYHSERIGALRCVSQKKEAIEYFPIDL